MRITIIKVKLFVASFLFLTFHVALSQPANDRCSNAIELTTGSVQCGQNATGTTADPCILDFSGARETDMWYYFQATNDTMILTFLQTNTTNCSPVIQVYGPYSDVATGCNDATGPGCTTCPSTVYDFDITADQDYQGIETNCYLISNLDPGNYIPLYGLTVGGYYLVRIINRNCGGSYDRFVQFCIGLYEPASNAFPQGATGINQCGTVFTGTTLGGYAGAFYCGTGFRDVNCDGTNDVSMIVNNPSWFYFCAAANGTWQVSYTIDSCIFSSPYAGGQIAIFVDTSGGSPNDISLVEESSSSCGATGPSQVPPGCTWTSSSFTVDSGQCAYMFVDGFAGDGCYYTLTLSNLSGGCVLSANISELQISCRKGIRSISWKGLSQHIKKYSVVFIRENGISEEVATIQYQPTKTYTVYDNKFSREKGVYIIYEISQNGKKTNIFSIQVGPCQDASPLLSIINDEIRIAPLGNICTTATLEVVNESGKVVKAIPIKCGSRDIVIPLNRLFRSEELNRHIHIFVLKTDKEAILDVLKY